MQTRTRWRALAVASCITAWVTARATPPGLYVGDWPGKIHTAVTTLPQPVVVGYPFEYFISSNGAAAIDATGLPAGLTIEHTYGRISGTPTEAGTFPIHITATAASGESVSADVSLTVEPTPTSPPVLSPISDRESVYLGGQPPTLLPDEVGGAFEIYFLLHGSNTPSKYSATGLPPQGAYLDSHGIISWDPDFLTPGVYTVAVQAENPAGASNVQTFRWTVHPAVIDITAAKTAYAYGDRMDFTATFSGPVVVTGTPYVPVRSGTRKAVYVSGSGTKTLTFTYTPTADDGVFTESAADHIELDGGTILGAEGLSVPLTRPPTNAYRDPYTVSASSSAAPVVAPIPDMESWAIEAGNIDQYQSLFVRASNSPTKWTCTGAPLPFNDSLSYPGFMWLRSELGGGEFTVTVTASNAVGSGSRTFKWIVHPATRGYITTDKRNYDVGDTITFTVHFSAPVVFTGTPYLKLWGAKRAHYVSGSGDFTWTFQYQVTADDLPQFSFGVQEISDDDGQVTTPGGTTAATRTVETISGQPPRFNVYTPAAISAQMINATVGQAVSTSIVARGAQSFKVTSGALPAGLSLDAKSGLVSGTPTTSGSAEVTIAVLDVTGGTASAKVTFAVAPANPSSTENPPPITNQPPPTTPPPPPETNPPPVITKTSPTITFSSPTGAVIVGQPISLGALSSAGLPIAYTVVSGDATLVGNTLTPNSTATLIVRASSAGNDSYNAASTDVNFGHPQAAAQQISFNLISPNVAAEQALTLSATSSSGLPITYTVVSGPATISGNTLTFTGTGNVTVRAAQDGNGGVGAASTEVTLTAHPVTRLVNISSRVHVSAGSDGATVGFVVTGTTPKKMLIRAVGDSLAAFGVNDGLSNPTLRLYGPNSALIATNAGWAGDAQIAAAANTVGAFGLATGKTDAALLVTLAPGLYSAQVTSPNSGSVLLEVYDAGATDAVPTKQLINISTRAHVDANNQVFQGFVISGDQPKRVLIRAVGATLKAFGVTDGISDPSLKLYSGETVIASNDDWNGAVTGSDKATVGTATEVATAAAAVGAFALPAGSKDASVLVTLQPGLYSVVVTGSDTQNGSVLVEAYEAP